MSTRTALRKSTKARTVTTATSSDYLEVPISSLEIGAQVPITLYTLVRGTYMRHWKKGDQVQQSNIDHLCSLGLNALWALARDRSGYLEFMKNSLAELPDRDDLDVKEKVSVCYDVGVTVAGQAYSDPGSRQAMSALEQLVETILCLFEKHSFTFTGLFEILDRNPSLHGHAVHTCMYAILLGKATGFEDLKQLGIGLLLHDVGKVAIEEEVSFEGTLSEEQWQTVRRHPQLGVRRAQRGNTLSSIVIDVIENHHERLDGTGYPRGISGDEISIASRIALIVNTFDSRTCHRVYRDRSKTFDVVQGMLRDEPDAFDTKLLHLFIRLLSS